MIISNKPITKTTIKSLKDLANFKTFMETNKLKINKSQIARELDIDPRTVRNTLMDIKSQKGHSSRWGMAYISINVSDDAFRGT